MERFSNSPLGDGGRGGGKLGNYITGKWITGDGEGQSLYNAVNGEVIAIASTKGLPFNEMLEYGRTVGNPALRKMTFHERGRMLKALAMHLMEKKKDFITSVIIQAQPGLIAG